MHPFNLNKVVYARRLRIYDYLCTQILCVPVASGHTVVERIQLEDIFRLLSRTVSVSIWRLFWLT